MDGFGPASYGDAFADVYDDWYAEITDVPACTATVAALAREVAGRERARVLELGVGTGRLALPLAAAGLDVRGLDASTAMLERLAAKQAGPGSTTWPVLGVRADMVDPTMPRRPGEAAAPAPDLVLCAYNTLFNLAGPEAQQRCLAGVGDLLAPGGRFVVEAFVPPAAGAADDDVVRVRHLRADAVVLSASIHEPAEQRIEGQYIEVRESGNRLRPWSVRYLTPHQLDEAGARAGLALEHRWAGWDRRPFGEGATDHVSVYRRDLRRP
jgi:SAM-dependent methyltransferase